MSFRLLLVCVGSIVKLRTKSMAQDQSREVGSRSKCYYFGIFPSFFIFHPKIGIFHNSLARVQVTKYPFMCASQRDSSSNQKETNIYSFRSFWQKRAQNQLNWFVLLSRGKPCLNIQRFSQPKMINEVAN